MIQNLTALPEFSEDLALRLILRGADVMIHLNDDLTVDAVRTDHQIGEIVLDHWVGAALMSLLTPESRPKVDYLMKDNSAAQDANSRWRHLNFIVDSVTTLPLLVKLFAYRNAGKARLLLSCRDLRSTADIHEQFMEEARRYEVEQSELRKTLALLQTIFGEAAKAEFGHKKN